MKFIKKPGSSEQPALLAGLDIGTSKIAVVVGEISPGGRIQILGIGISAAHGLRQGVVTNLDQAVIAIRKAVDEAQLTAGVRVDDVIVGIAGDHIRGVNSRGVVGVHRADHEIIQQDVERVIDAAKAIALPIDRELIHVLPQEFIVDSQGGIKNPVGITGVRLEAEVHIVTGAVTSAQNIIRCVRKSGLKVAALVLEPLAASCAVLGGNEKEMGVAFVDIGGGITDLAVFYKGAIRHTGVVGLGGQSVTNDIAMGLRTSVEQAEEIKRKIGCAWPDLALPGQSFLLKGVGGKNAREITPEDLVPIVQPRMEEILSLVLKEMKRTEAANSLGAGVVLTGGGSMIEGTVELAESVFGMPAKIGYPHGIGGLAEMVSTPVMSTGVGLLLYAVHNESEIGQEFYDADESRWFQRILHWMHKWVEDFI